MNIVFCGSPEFALPSLKILAASHNILAVITQKQKPQGRGLIIRANPIENWAHQNNIPILSPEHLKDAKEEILKIEMDLLIVVAYGKIIPTWLLNHPKLACINVHASLLPRWRGAAPIHSALIAGDMVTGISIMRIEQGLDTGGYWLQKSLEITNTSTFISLHDSLAIMGAEALAEVVQKELYNNPVILQDDTQTTYSPKLSAQDFLYQLNFTTKQIQQSLRAFYPKPGLRASLNGQELRLIMSGSTKSTTTDKPGTLINVDHEGLWLATVDGMVAITMLQRSSHAIQTVASLRNGWPISLTLGQQLAELVI